MSRPKHPPSKFTAPKGYEKRQSEVSLVMSHFFLKYLHFIYRNFSGDLTLGIVLGEVAHHNVTRHFASQISVEKTGSLALPADGLWDQLEGCNAFSLSHATGIPRETVRRKIKQLEKLGWVARSARGDVTITPAVAEFFLPERNLELLTELRATNEVIEQLLSHGAKANP